MKQKKKNETNFAIVRGVKSDELIHWKYVKKYKKNGKWHYVYDVGSTGDTINGEKMSSYRQYTKIQDVLGYDERDAASIADTNYQRDRNNAKRYNDEQTKNPYYKQYESDRLYRKATQSGKTASEAMKRYYKTPLGMIDRADDVVDRGRKTISNVLTKLAKTVSPKKETKLKTTNYDKTKYVK